MPAPVFPAAAAGVDVANPISVEGRLLSLARPRESNPAEITNNIVGHQEEPYPLNLVWLHHGHQSEMHPADNRLLHPGDVIAAPGGRNICRLYSEIKEGHG